MVQTISFERAPDPFADVVLGLTVQRRPVVGRTKRCMPPEGADFLAPSEEVRGEETENPSPGPEWRNGRRRRLRIFRRKAYGFESRLRHQSLKALIAGDLAKLEEAFAVAGAPWTPGRRRDLAQSLGTSGKTTGLGEK
jgi:hypothetical protein